MLKFIFLEVKTGACVNPLATKIFNAAKDFFLIFFTMADIIK